MKIYVGENREEKRDWFHTPAAKLAAISAASFGIYKIRGPIRSLVDKYINQHKEKILRHDINKYYYKPQASLNDEFDINKPFYGINRQPEYKTLKTDPYTIDSIDRLESEIFNRVNGKTEVGLDKDALLHRARKEALSEYLATNSSLGITEADFDTVNSLPDDVRVDESTIPIADFGDVGAETRKSEAMSKYYIEKNSEFAELYRSKLRNMKTRWYRNVANHVSSEPGRIVRRSDHFRSDQSVSFLYDDISKFSNDLVDNIRLATDAKYIRKKFQNNINVFQLYKEKNLDNITSGSLSKMNVNLASDKRFKLLGMFDYTKDLQNLCQTLDELKSEHRGIKSRIENTEFNITNEGSSKNPRYMGIINITRKADHTHSRKTYELKIPISQNGIIPGSAPGVTDILDGFYLKDEAKFAGRKNLLVNRDLQNKTQMILRKLNDMLQSEQIEGLLAGNPSKGISRLNSVVNNILEDAPRRTGEARDIFKLFRLNTKTKYSDRMLNNLNDAMTSINSIRKISRAKANKEDFAIVTLDLETINPDFDKGPEWSARSPHTQITKGGLSLEDYEGGKLRNVDADEMVADYAIDHLRSVNKGMNAVTGEEYNKGFINWLRMEIGPRMKSAVSNPTGETDPYKLDDSRVVEIWEELLKKDTQRYNNMFGLGKNGGIKDNQEFSNRILKRVSDYIDRVRKNNPGKKVYLRTKNGNQFDLNLLNEHAGSLLRKIQGETTSIDFQNVVLAARESGSYSGSMGLGKAVENLNHIMGNKIGNLDFSTTKNFQKAIKTYIKEYGKGFKLEGSEFMDKFKAGQFTLRAHQSPVADCMLTSMLHGLMEHMITDGAMKDESRIARMISEHKKFLEVEETFEEHQILERDYKIHGMITSSSGLSHGQIAKQLSSLLPISHLLPYSGNKLSGQWDQIFRGVTIRHTLDKGNKKISSMERKRFLRKRFMPSFISKWESNANSWEFGVDAPKNHMVKRIKADTIFTLNPWIGQGGYTGMSESVLDNVEILLKKNISLTDASTEMNNPEISNSLKNIQRQIMERAKRIASNKNQPTMSNFEEAVHSVLEGSTDQISLSESTVLAKGDKGYVYTKNKQLFGKITAIHLSDDAGKIRMYADMEQIVKGSNLNSMGFVAQNIGTKAQSYIIPRDVSEIFSMGGANAIANADFIEKGYVGSQKQMITEKIIERLNDVRSTGTREQKIHAKNTMERLANDLKSQVQIDPETEYATFMHDPDIEGNFPNIHDKEARKQAQKVIGNIDMNMEKLSGYMVDANVVWTTEKAKEWYGLFGGRKEAEKWLNNTIKNANENIEKEYSSKKSAINHYERKDIDHIKENQEKWMRRFLLPEWEDIKQGKAPMFLEAIKLNENKTTIGFRHPGAMWTFAVREGTQAKTHQLKFKDHVLGSFESDHVPKSLLNELRSQHRLSQVESKYKDIAKSIDGFSDILLNKATMEKDLSIDEIRSLLDRFGNLKVENLKKLSDGELEKLNSQLDDFKVQFDYGDQGELVDQVIKDMRSETLAKKFKENKAYMSRSATEQWTRILKDRRAISLSVDERLGGTFSFNLDKIIKNILPETEQYLAGKHKDTIKKALEMIQSKTGDKIVAGVNGDTISLNKLVMQTRREPDSIMNILNPKGGEAIYGFKTPHTKYTTDVLESIEIYDNLVSKNVSESVLSAQKETVAQNYARYLLKGINISKDSLASKAINDIAPVGHGAQARGASIVIDQAKEILERHSKGDSTILDRVGSSRSKEIKKLLERISSSRMDDAFITHSMFSSMKIRQDGKIQNVKGALRKNLKDIFPNMSMGDIERVGTTLPGYMTRYPHYQAGVDAILGLRLNIIPDDVGTELGMNSNEINAHSAFVKNTLGGDFDGDRFFFAARALKDAETMGTLFQEQSQALRRVVEDSQETMNDLTKPRIKHWDRNKGKVVVGMFDRESFEYKEESFKVDSDKGKRMFVDLFGDVADGLSESAKMDPSIVNSDYIYNKLDHISAIDVSSSSMGKFTNAVYRRQRQIKMVGEMGKNSVSSIKLLGNVKQGLSAIGQSAITMKKHPTDIQLYEKAYKAIKDSNTQDIEAHNALKQIFEEVNGKDGSELYKSYTTAVREFENVLKHDDVVRLKIQADENIDMGKASFADTILSQIEIENQKIRQNMPTAIQGRSTYANIMDNLKQKYKFDPGTVANFKKVGKIAALGSLAYIGLNFFRPNQLSNSSNPLDAFADLGTDLDADNRYIVSNMELPRSVALDSVNPSFSKKAFIRMNNEEGDNKSRASKIVNDMVKESFDNFDVFRKDFTPYNRGTYKNYTTHIGSFGNSNTKGL